MRWRLRNKEKIKDFFSPNGDKMVARMELAISNFFKDHENFSIEKDCTIIEGNQFPVIIADDPDVDLGEIWFYVISVRYDVVLLAYKTFCS